MRKPPVSVLAVFRHPACLVYNDRCRPKAYTADNNKRWLKLDTDQLNRWITLGANLGVLVGVFLLLIELRQNTESAELQAAQSYVALSHELDFRIVDDPSLIALFRTPPNKRTPEGLQRMDRWYFGSLRTWENGFYLHSRGVLDDDLWSGQQAFMADMLRNNEELRNYFETNRNYFSKGFIAFLERLLETKAE